eukprot:GHRR01011712.1.p1 GENE.GHRR01011712.1~~GHRR01011712.1.p1  ORF type:complete len:194 (+),score=66.66 GHRR01011712.1:247-828(+)
MDTGALPTMSKAKANILDAALDAVSDGSSSDGDDSRTDGADEAGQQQQMLAKKHKAEITIEDLQKQGYQSGPSVLFMKPPDGPLEQNWNWSNGKAEKAREGSEETYEERTRTHEAATSAAEESARLAMKAAEHAAKLRQQAKQEQQELAKQKKLSFNQKEKRKRDAGMQSRGKSTVEEEKRVARQYGVYSGFD